MLRIIAGKHQHRQLAFPTGEKAIRPTMARIRKAVFDICQNQIEGASFLDLCAGTGAMGLEALSQGASHATFVENAPKALVVIRKNINNLVEAAFTTILRMDISSALAKIQNPFDIIYFDPPYDLLASSCPQTMFNELPRLLNKDGLLFIESRTSLAHSLPIPKGLTLKKQRKFGQSSLFQYTYI